MKLMHYMKKENSGLARTTLEFAQYEEKAGHVAMIKEPSGGMVYGIQQTPDVECIHSQMPPESYINGVPKFMWIHGEPLSSVGNGVSMKAIVDLAPKIDAFLCMRQEEHAIWNSIKRTYLVPKGIDLERYKPLEGPVERLSGEPAVLYCENWRGSRNPLYLCVAMQEVWKQYPKARLHLYNCNEKRVYETFNTLIKHNKWWTFIRTLTGAVEHINLLYNKVDMVVSCLYPLYARSIEALGAGKAFIGPGYREPGYPWTCELEPHSMAEAIMACWADYHKLNYRKWAVERHDVAETVKQSLAVYERYI